MQTTAIKRMDLETGLTSLISVMVSVDVKHHVYLDRVPGEIKRSRDLRGGEVELDSQLSPEEIMSREVELG